MPFELLVRHEGMHYLPPFAITAAREVEDQALIAHGDAYCQHVVSAQPAFTFDGKPDSRAITMYPAHYHVHQSQGVGPGFVHTRPTAL